MPGWIGWIEEEGLQFWVRGDQWRRVCNSWAQGNNDTLSVWYAIPFLFCVCNSISLPCFFFMVNYSVTIDTRNRRQVGNVPEKFLNDTGH